MEANEKLSQAQKENEGQAKANVKLVEELADRESKMNDEAKLSAKVAKKDEAAKQLHDLTMQRTAEVEALKSLVFISFISNDVMNHYGGRS